MPRKTPLKKKSLSRAAHIEAARAQPSQNRLFHTLRSNLPRRCWPETYQDWHGTLVMLLWIATLLLLLLPSAGFEDMYKWCDVFSGIVNSYVALLLLRALFQQASLPATPDELTPQQQAVLNYDKIQQQRWKSFVPLKEQQQKAAMPNNNNGNDLEDDDEDPDDTWQWYRLKMGPCPVPYGLAGLVTLVMATWTYIQSWRHELYYLSLTKLTSLVDWFRTFSLLSFGFLGASVLLYMWPVVVHLAKRVRAWWQTCWTRQTKEEKESNKSASVAQNTLGSGYQAPGSETNAANQSEQPHEQEQPQDKEEKEASTSEILHQHVMGVSSKTVARTAQDTFFTTRAAVVLSLVSLALTLYFGVQRYRLLHQISPAMNWRRGSGVLYSYQGDAWVTGYEIVQEDNRQEYCATPYDFINVKLNVAYGGEWACPNSPEIYCETELEAQVSCELTTGALTWNGNNNNGNNNNGEEEEGQEQNGVFYSVQDYVRYRYQDPEQDDENENDDENANDNNANGDMANYDPDQAPNGVVNGVASWNRQGEFIVGNCDTCQARSLTYINSKFPEITRALHGLFPSLGSLVLNLTWTCLAKMAQQMRQRAHGVHLSHAAV